MSSDSRLDAIYKAMEGIIKEMDETTKWLSEHMNKGIHGNAFGDVLTEALFGGGILGSVIGTKVRNAKKNTRIIYNGMTADDMGQDIVCKITRLVDYQQEVQSIVTKEDIDHYYNMIDVIMSYGAKYHSSWSEFASYYVLNHKIEYNGKKRNLEEAIRMQWQKEFLRLDLKEEFREALLSSLSK